MLVLFIWKAERKFQGLVFFLQGKWLVELVVGVEEIEYFANAEVRGIDFGENFREP